MSRENDEQVDLSRHSLLWAAYFLCQSVDHLPAHPDQTALITKLSVWRDDLWKHLRDHGLLMPKGAIPFAGTEFRTVVERELAGAYVKHGREPWSRHEFFGVLREEVDELWENIKRDGPTENILKEAAQIACVCQRYAETGDRYRGNHSAVWHR